MLSSVSLIDNLMRENWNEKLNKYTTKLGRAYRLFCLFSFGVCYSLEIQHKSWRYYYYFFGYTPSPLPCRLDCPQQASLEIWEHSSDCLHAQATSTPQRNMDVFFEKCRVHMQASANSTLGENAVMPGYVFGSGNAIAVWTGPQTLMIFLSNPWLISVGYQVCKHYELGQIQAFIKCA